VLAKVLFKCYFILNQTKGNTMPLLLLIIQGGLMGAIAGMTYPITEDPVTFFLWVIPNAILVVAYGVAYAAEKE
jgi:hypothetical protein